MKIHYIFLLACSLQSLQARFTLYNEIHLNSPLQGFTVTINGIDRGNFSKFPFEFPDTGSFTVTPVYKTTPITAEAFCILYNDPAAGTSAIFGVSASQAIQDGASYQLSSGNSNLLDTGCDTTLGSITVAVVINQINP